MTNAAQKTPISLLQELCAQQGMTPDYKLMSVEGAVHAPTFMYRVQVNEVMATATGQSKKKAKHAAAKAVLERLLAKDGEFHQGFVSDGVMVNAETLNDVIAGPTCSQDKTADIRNMLILDDVNAALKSGSFLSQISREPTAVPPPEENAEDNPVGKLQEHCMKKRWQPPYYETENATGLPHEKIFTIMCFVDKFTTTGEGKSKRLAKRQAAAKMLERLSSMKNVSDEEEEMAKENSNEDEALSKNSAVADDKDESEFCVNKSSESENSSKNDVSATENMVTCATQPCDSESSVCKIPDIERHSESITSHTQPCDLESSFNKIPDTERHTENGNASALENMVTSLTQHCESPDKVDFSYISSLKELKIDSSI